MSDQPDKPVDLASLTIEDATIPARPAGPRLFALLVLVLTLVVAGTFLWPILRPARAVRTVPVRIARAATADAASPAASTTEAVGWVEADPFPTIVRPLVSGHIETLQVLEGAVVVKDETVIGTMVSAALLAARDRAQATWEERTAALTRAEADDLLAKERLRQNAAARLRLREAENRLEALRTKRATARESLRRATAAARSAEAAKVAQEQLAQAGSSYPVALERARAHAAAATAEVSLAEQQVQGLDRELAAQQQTVELCAELTKDPVDLRGAAAVAAAQLAVARAACATARTELTIAEREWGWATVRAPMDGVVLRLEARPGDMVGHGASGMVALYDPKKLRARIDVPLDSLTGIFVGQKVEIRSEAIGEQVVAGVVQRLQHETDMLKNTLQVKIGLIDPPPLLRPETLCRARFLAPQRSGEDPAATSIQAFRVPAAAVQNGQVFVFDPASRTARPIPVEVLGDTDGDRIVRGALSPTQRIVIEPVRPGEAIQERQP